jgi:hypothetical protein
MKLTSLAVAVIAGALTLSACNDSILDVTPVDQISGRAVFSDVNLAQAFLNDAYRGIGHGYYGTTLFSLTDDGHNTRGGGAMRHNQGLVTASDLQALGDASRFGHYLWGPLYKAIRETNVFLAGIDSAQFDPTARAVMKGQALFLRAYYYHNLLKMYGGVPIIRTPYGLSDDFEVARDSFDATVEFIVSDLDSAAAMLPLTWDAANLGRATKGAAMALKARVLVHAASDLFAVNPSRRAETGHVGSVDRGALWRRARDASRAVVDLGVYDLYKADPSPSDSLSANYNGIWLSRTNSEIIFARYFLTSRGTTDLPNVGRYDGPNGYHNWGSNTPTGQLVDAYRMADGSRFDWSDSANRAHPYENRDARLYASIQFDGEPWVKRPADVLALEPQGIIQTFTQLTLPNGTTVAGVDTHASPIENWNATYSGYYKKKMIDPAVDHQFVSQDVPWIFIRYAEVLLDYAEASYELGDEATARAMANRIRHRVRMPDFPSTLTGTALRDELRNERRVELAFEDQRYFDVRRWMIAPTVNNENAHGIDIKVKATNQFDRSTYHDYTYTVMDVETRHWDDKMYFSPIPRDEINRNALLKQNPGF